MMKVILSRKGADSSYNMCSFIENNNFIMVPIPESKEFCAEAKNFNNVIQYKDLAFIKGNAILKNKERYCHLDPDLINGVLGQCGAAQTHLKNQNIDVGDIFVFFGLYKDKNILKHIIFGYLQIEKIIKLPPNEKEDIIIITKEKAENVKVEYFEEYCKNNNMAFVLKHPHYNFKWYNGQHYNKNNTIYLAADKLSFDKNKRGFGVFEYSDKLVLTANFLDGMKNNKATFWDKNKIPQVQEISYNKNSRKENYFKAACIGQEFVINPKNETEEESLKTWLNELFKKQN